MAKPKILKLNKFRLKIKVQACKKVQIMYSQILVVLQDFYGHLKSLTTRWQQQLGCITLKPGLGTGH